MTITRHPDGCLLLFPRPEWEVFRAKIVNLTMDAKWFQRIFLGSAADVELDTAGRVLIAPELRQAAKLEKEVMLLGMGSRFEIWDKETYDTQEQEAMSQGMPESLKNFTF